MSIFPLKEKVARDFITIVSGLPRSGTSMMMKMLDSGNMPLLTDNMRIADQDNPRGYYEYERVKELEQDNSWLDMASGKAVKIVSPLLHHLNLNKEYRYKIIFMRRNLEEILASQRKMADRLREGEDKIRDDILMHNYSLHLEDVHRWQQQNENIELLYINYSDVIKDPLSVAECISNFLDMKLNIHEMAKVVDDSLYRQRVVTTNNNVIDATEEKTENELIAERLQYLGYL